MVVVIAGTKTLGGIGKDEQVMFPRYGVDRRVIRGLAKQVDGDDRRRPQIALRGGARDGFLIFQSAFRIGQPAAV